MVTFKTAKVVKSRVLYDATKEHPAQIERWNEDERVARVETVHTSGMITSANKARYLRNLDKLIAGVKKARQRANCVETKSLKVSEAMFDFILS